MIELVREGVIPNTHNKRYIIDSPEERSNLEVDFGNEAYCISNKTTYICNGSGVYVEKESSGGGGGASAAPLIVTLTFTGTGMTSLTANVTNGEIANAIAAGRQVWVGVVEESMSGNHFYAPITQTHDVDSSFSGCSADVTIYDYVYTVYNYSDDPSNTSWESTINDVFKTSVWFDTTTGEFVGADSLGEIADAYFRGIPVLVTFEGIRENTNFTLPISYTSWVSTSNVLSMRIEAYDQDSHYLFIASITGDESQKQWVIDPVPIANMRNVTYNELRAMVSTGKLAPGMQYRIIDYSTIINGTYDLSDMGAQGYVHYARSARNDFFDIIVTADDASHLNENARACRREGSTYAPDAKPEAWEIHYTIDNDPTKYAWADSTNGKGVIYYMKDEHNNSAWYDFKNIQFLRYALKIADDIPSDIAEMITPSNDLSLYYDSNNYPWRRYGDILHLSTALSYYMNTGSYTNPFFTTWNGDTNAHIYDFYVGDNILGTVEFPEVDETYLSTFNADWYYTFGIYDNGTLLDASVYRFGCVNNHIEMGTDLYGQFTNNPVTGLNGSVIIYDDLVYDVHIGVNCLQNTVSSDKVIIDDNSEGNIVVYWKEVNLSRGCYANIIDGESSDITLTQCDHFWFWWSSDINIDGGTGSSFVESSDISLPRTVQSCSFNYCQHISSNATSISHVHADTLRHALLVGVISSVTFPKTLASPHTHEVIGMLNQSQKAWHISKTGYNQETVLSTTDGGQTWS